MERSFVIPSVFEENSSAFLKVANSLVDGIRLVNFKGKDYVVGNLALREGVVPHKLMNCSADDIDYQLIMLSSLLVSSMGGYKKLVVTTGFPSSTYRLFKGNAEKFLQGTHSIQYDGRPLGREEIGRFDLEVEQVEVLPEIEGCSHAVRALFNEKDNFFVVSLGYGTFELALSTLSGLVNRTSYSTRGLAYAVNLLEIELQKQYYLEMLTEHQLEKAFQRGSIVANRNRVNLFDLRSNILKTYYNEVISPAMRKKLNDEDFVNTKKIYLAGGGAMYPELVDMFRAEFHDLLEVIVYPEPYLCAAKGYCMHALSKRRSQDDATGIQEKIAYVGIDLGNSNTGIVVNTPD